MTSNDALSERESWEHTFYYFIQNFLVLAMLPSDQCAESGNYNVGWELRDQGLKVDFLLNQNVIEFSDCQKEGMRNLSLVLHAMGDDAIRGGTNLEANLLGMQNQEWIPVREIAKKLILDLAPKTLENRKYFNMPLQ